VNSACAGMYNKCGNMHGATLMNNKFVFRKDLELILRYNVTG